MVHLRPGSEGRHAAHKHPLPLPPSLPANASPCTAGLVPPATGAAARLTNVLLQRHLLRQQWQLPAPSQGGPCAAWHFASSRIAALTARTPNGQATAAPSPSRDRAAATAPPAMPHQANLWSYTLRPCWMGVPPGRLGPCLGHHALAARPAGCAHWRCPMADKGRPPLLLHSLP
jgi:hypothetical protein